MKTRKCIKTIKNTEDEIDKVGENNLRRNKELKRNSEKTVNR
jgi:hypothetical protein